VVANKKAESVDVSFELTEFVSEDGARRFRAPVAFTPDRVPWSVIGLDATSHALLRHRP